MEKVVLYITAVVLAFFAISTAVVVMAPFIAIGLIVWILLLIFPEDKDIDE